MSSDTTPPRIRTVDRLIVLEWVAVLLASVLGFFLAGGPWWLFLLLILAPDLSMAGYAAGPRIGAVAYNLAHLMVWPAALFVAGLALDSATALQVAAVWIAHIALDRALGYGLKLPEGFTETHLGRIGARRLNP